MHIHGHKREFKNVLSTHLLPHTFFFFFCPPDIAKFSCVAVMETHVSVVRTLDITADERYLISSGRDKVICRWDLKTNSLEKTIPVFEVWGIFSFSISLYCSPVSFLFVCVYSSFKKNDLVLFFFKGIEAAGILRHDAQLQNGDIVGTRTLVFAGGEKGTLSIWDIDAGECYMKQIPEENSKHSLVDVM